MALSPSLSRSTYRGRFAPSPSGPLHFGSLVAALGSYLDAKTHGGEWLLRIEDIDTPRSVPGASTGILRTLEAFGFEWDGAVLYQSARTEIYRATWETLRRQGALYACACSRREIELATDGAAIYPGTCRNGLAPGRAPRAWRVKVNQSRITFVDAVQGEFAQDLSQATGDFVVLRADGLFAYQLAVVVDDAEQGITHVVRGADLLDSTPRQIHMQHLLGFPTPHYAHLPLALNHYGEKLSKQTQAPALDPAQALPSLFAAWHFLGQTPAPKFVTLEEFWQWAKIGWRMAQVPRVKGQPETV